MRLRPSQSPARIACARQRHLLRDVRLALFTLALGAGVILATPWADARENAATNGATTDSPTPAADSTKAADNTKAADSTQSIRATNSAQTADTSATAAQSQTAAPSAATGTREATKPTAIPGIVQVGQSINGISQYQLANGLTVLLGPDESKPTMTVNLVYKVGSRHEGPGEAGMAHLLEHMLFKGTKAIPNPKKELTRLGIEWNGTTWYDRTNYFGQFNASDKTRDWMLGWLADTMHNIQIDAGKLKSERPVVINEMEAGENRPASVLYQQLMATAYGFHPYARSVIGALSDVDAVHPDNLQTFYQRYYRPDNAVLIITGQFDVNSTLAAIQKDFGPIARPATPIPQPWTLDPAQQGEREIVIRRTGGVPLMMAGYHTPASADRDTVALSILAEMLTREPDGPLYQQLVKPGYAVSIGSYATNVYDPGMLVFSATLAGDEEQPANGKQPAGNTGAANDTSTAATNGTSGSGAPAQSSGTGNAAGTAPAARLTLAQRQQKVWDTVRKVVEGEQPLTQEALDRTKQDIRNGIARLADDPEALAMELTEAIAQGDWRLPFAQADWADSMTLDDIRAAGRRWLVRDNRTLAWYLPTEKPVRAPAPAHPDIAGALQNHTWKTTEAFKADVALTPASIAERTQTGKLAGGIEYAILPRRVKGDRVNLNLNLQWGNLQNLADRWRDADLLDAMLLSGTRTLTRQQLQDKLRGLDAQLGTSAGNTGVKVTLNVPAKNLSEALALAIDALRNPVFPQDIFNEKRERALTAIEARRQQPEALAAEALAERSHQYPASDPRHYRNPRQVIADLKAQTPARIEKFWQDFAGASNGQFTVVGNVQPDALKAELEKRLGDWKSPQAYAHIRTEYHGLPSDKVQIDVPDKANAVLNQVRAIPVSEDHPDYPALFMAVRLLGGTPDARLFHRLREQESISYGAYASLSAARDVDSASLDIQAILAPANIERLQKALQEEVDRAYREGFDQAELDASRSALMDQRRQILSGEGFVASLLASNLFWHTDMTRWTRRDQQLQALTLEQVNAAYRKWIDPNKALTISAGSFRDKAGATKKAAERSSK